MAVPMRVASTIWSRRPTCSGQSRWRTRICMAAMTTPSPPSRLTSLSSWSLASCRDWPTSSVQPATSALPDPQRAWRAVVRSSCRDPIEMPSDKPCRYPARDDQLGEILPGQVRGKGHRRPVRGARRADRGADGRELQPAEGKYPLDSRTPTTPCPPSAAHSAVIRPTAVSRVWYMACTSGPNEPDPPRPDTWVASRADTPSPGDPWVPGQLYPLADPAP